MIIMSGITLEETYTLHLTREVLRIQVSQEISNDQIWKTSSTSECNSSKIVNTKLLDTTVDQVCGEVWHDLELEYFGEGSLSKCVKLVGSHF